MDSKTTIISALPLVIILTALSAAIIFAPQNQDIRNRAAQNVPGVTTPTPTKTPILTPTPTPQTACSSLYNPVCGSDQVTYENACQAQQAGVTVISSSPCTTPLPQGQ